MNEQKLPFPPPKIERKDCYLIVADVYYFRQYYEENNDDELCVFCPPKTEYRTESKIVGVTNSIEDAKDIIKQVREKTVENPDNRWQVKNIKYRFNPVQYLTLKG